VHIPLKIAQIKLSSVVSVTRQPSAVLLHDNAAFIAKETSIRVYRCTLDVILLTWHMDLTHVTSGKHWTWLFCPVNS